MLSGMNRVGRPLEARHVSVSIERPPALVYAFAVNTANLPRWASGLANGVSEVRFADENSFGVLDHAVVLESGETVQSAMRVITNEGGSEIIFTLTRRPEASAAEFAADAATVQHDLLTLKRLIEEQPEDASRAGAQHVHHGIDYIELTVTDMAAALSFYTAAFGWRFNSYGPGYSGIQGNGREVGGLCAGAAVNAGSPLVLLYSSDLNATLFAVREAGGTIVKEPYDFPGGRRFHFADPSGNELGVWSYV
jgi:predicted enzyme related to lactoylglutathione lyase